MAEQEDVIWFHGEVTIVELARSSGLAEPVLRELVEYGALAPSDPGAEEWCFGADCVARLRTAARLMNDLELETPAVALAISFLERIEELEAQVRHLNARLVAPRR